jgi:ribosomal protein RSM22 (predicted rRNA methylase)
MSQVQEIFNRLQKFKGEQKELKTMYRDALRSSSEFQRVKEELDKLKEEKKAVEAKIKEEFANELDKMEVLGNEIKNDSQVLSDAALSKLMKGEKLEVRDEYEVEYEPIVSVKFQKIK